MAMRSKYGTVDRRNPEAAGRCDRGGEIRKRSELQKEMVWAGNTLVWNGFYVCDKHRDPPHPQDRVVRLKPDPMPIRDPRPQIDPTS